MNFVFGFDLIPQGIVGLTRTRNQIKTKKKRRKKQCARVLGQLLRACPRSWSFSIHRGIQELANGNVGASDLQQTQPLAKEGLCKHKLDAASCKGEDADEASDQLLNHDVYK